MISFSRLRPGKHLRFSLSEDLSRTMVGEASAPQWCYGQAHNKLMELDGYLMDTCSKIIAAQV